MPGEEGGRRLGCLPRVDGCGPGDLQAGAFPGAEPCIHARDDSAGGEGNHARARKRTSAFVAEQSWAPVTPGAFYVAEAGAGRPACMK